jgi:hypothetical protein
VARRFHIAFLMLLWLGCCGLVRAQSVPAQQPPAQADGAVDITLGQSLVPLYGPWKYTVGDSPVDPITHAPLWAEPGFDDSKWETADLTPKNGELNRGSGLTGFVPGWTVKGHPGYWGYAWYRIRVHLETPRGEKLALAGPPVVDDVFQVFDNGGIMGSFGTFSSSEPVTYYQRPTMFLLPQPAGGNPGSSTHVLAFRVWMEPSDLATEPDAGGFHSAPVVGEAGAVAAGYRLGWLELVRSYSILAFQAVLYALLALVTFSLILFDRSDRVYLWMGAMFLLRAIANFLKVLGGGTAHLSIFAVLLIIDGILNPLLFAGWVMVWWVWFGRQGPAWLPRAVAGLALLQMISIVVGEEMFFALVPHTVAVAFQMVSVVVRLLFFALLVWIVIQGIRSRGLEGWLVLPVLPLLGIGTFQTELALLHIQLSWYPFGMRVSLSEVASLLLAVALAMLLLRRLLLSVRRQRRMALDVKQAQEVQQVILPEARMTLPGLVIESEYLPALNVGGDFFQIIPHPTDGSLLIVAGDVTGKGLKAGMTVALLVGAIRTAAETSAEPKFVLEALNRRLLGRSDAQATCLALCIAADGEITLVNAGHVPPYLNGEPVAMEGALPLGILPEADFSVMRFKLAEGDRLVLMTDGIVEATDANGQLFGFERVHDLLRTASSAAEVASAAQSFVQEDDISVISITRVGVLEPALV